MTLVIRDGETQRAFVARTLERDGSISAHEACFDLRDEQGRPRAVTRLAACIEALRSDGWAIETDARHGEQAVYRLSGAPTGHGPSRDGGRAPSLPQSAPPASPAPMPARPWSADSASPEDGSAVPSPAAGAGRTPDPMPWRREWRCATCGSLPSTEPEQLLGGMGAARCETCGRRTVFRRAA